MKVTALVLVLSTEKNYLSEKLPIHFLSLIKVKKSVAQDVYYL